MGQLTNEKLQVCNLKLKKKAGREQGAYNSTGQIISTKNMYAEEQRDNHKR